MAEWISVKERLPKYGDYVLGLGPKHGYYICEYRGLTGLPEKASPWFTTQGRSVKITHWMPLPEQPEERRRRNGMTNADAIRTMKNDALAIMIFEFVNGCTCKDCPAFYNCWDNNGNKINEKTFKNCLESIDAWLEQESIYGN